jgi:hypothetical protein
MSSTYSIDILRKCEKYYKQVGISTNWAEPTEDSPYYTLAFF